MHIDDIYFDLVKDVLNNGIQKLDRTNTGIIEVFGRQVHINLQEGFPILTTKKIHFKSVVHELLWFLSGSTNVKYLQDNGVRIWNEWADKDGEIGPMYGYQWRKGFNGIDQIKKVIELIKKEPDSRRICMTTYNVGDLDKMALEPCHGVFTQFNVTNNKLNCSTMQRSGDLGLGVPFNFCSYALLTHMLAQVCNLEVGNLIYSFNSLHIYVNHIEKLKEQLIREKFSMPTLKLNPTIKNIDVFKFEDINLLNYQFHPLIQLKVAV